MNKEERFRSRVPRKAEENQPREEASREAQLRLKEETGSLTVEEQLVT